MKTLFEEQAAERDKPIHDIEKLTAQVQQLHNDLRTEKRSRVDAETSTAKLKIQLDAEQDHRTVRSNELAQAKLSLKASRTASNTAEAKLAEEAKLRVEADKALKNYCTTVEAKLKISRAFYDSQKELPELQVAACAPELKAAILRAFEDEYGELGRE
jgi:hypothetical protein